MKIDESVLARRKYNRGRVIPENWVFEIYDTVQKRGYITLVNQRDSATLIPIIERFYLPGIYICFDCWGASRNLGNFSEFCLIRTQ